MPASIINLLYVLLSIFIISMIVALPILVLIGLMQFYDSYKKKRDKEIKEADKIILRKNDKILQQTEGIKVLDELDKKLRIKELEQRESIRLLQLEKQALQIELGHNVDGPEDLDHDEETEMVDYSTMTIKELHDIAKELGLTGYSRWKKDKLVSVLENGQ